MRSEREVVRADPTHEEQQSLWLLILGPTIWAAHFLVSYISAAVWCARFAADQRLAWMPGFVLTMTVAALAGIALVARVGWQRHSHGGGRHKAPHDADTPDDRHRFLGFATLLLALLSAVATAFVGGTAFFFEDCR